MCQPIHLHSLQFTVPTLQSLLFPLLYMVSYVPRMSDHHTKYIHYNTYHILYWVNAEHYILLKLIILYWTLPSHLNYFRQSLQITTIHTLNTKSVGTKEYSELLNSYMHNYWIMNIFFLSNPLWIAVWLFIRAPYNTINVANTITITKSIETWIYTYISI